MIYKTRRGLAWYTTAMAFIGQVFVGVSVFFATQDQMLTAWIWAIAAPIWLLSVWLSASTGWRMGWMEHANGDLT